MFFRAKNILKLAPIRTIIQRLESTKSPSCKYELERRKFDAICAAAKPRKCFQRVPFYCRIKELKKEPTENQECNEYETNFQCPSLERAIPDPCEDPRGGCCISTHSRPPQWKLDPNSPKVAYMDEDCKEPKGICCRKLPFQCLPSKPRKPRKPRKMPDCNVIETPKQKARKPVDPCAEIKKTGSCCKIPFSRTKQPKPRRMKTKGISGPNPNQRMDIKDRFWYQKTWRECYKNEAILECLKGAK